MLKILVRKNLQEVGATYFRDKKSGGKKVGGAMAGMAVLYIVLFILLAGSFAAMAALFFSVSSAESSWIVWAIMGIIGVAMATLINALTCYSQLYLARDTEILLSMPIKPGTIVQSRMLSVYVMGLIYFSMIWIPTMIIGIVTGKMTAASLVPQLLMLLIVGLLILGLTCVFGWVVAYFTVKFKNQKIATVIVAVLFLIAVYYLQFKTNTLLNRLADNMDKAGDVIKHSIYPFYQLGRAACGNIVGMLVFTAISVLILLLSYMLLTKTFIKMSGTKAAGKTVKYKEAPLKQTSVLKALLNKEKTRFTGSVTCMLNFGLGIIIVIAGGAFLLIKSGMIEERIGPLLEIPGLAKIVPLTVVAVVCMLESMSCYTAASISLDGKNIWLLQTMPVNIKDIFEAKIKFGTYIEALPGAFLAYTGCKALGVNSTMTIIIMIFALFYGRLNSVFGIFINLKRPNLTWTSEQTPVKQGMPVALTMFGGWLFGIIIAGIGYLIRDKMAMDTYVAICSCVMISISFYLSKWVNTKGVEIFRYL